MLGEKKKAFSYLFLIAGVIWFLVFCLAQRPEEAEVPSFCLRRGSGSCSGCPAHSLARVSARQSFFILVLAGRTTEYKHIIDTCVRTGKSQRAQWLSWPFWFFLRSWKTFLQLVAFLGITVPTEGLLQSKFCKQLASNCKETEKRFVFRMGVDLYLNLVIALKWGRCKDCSWVWFTCCQG